MPAAEDETRGPRGQEGVRLDFSFLFFESLFLWWLVFRGLSLPLRLELYRTTENERAKNGWTPKEHAAIAVASPILILKRSRVYLIDPL